jgi:hypothetical protein
MSNSIDQTTSSETHAEYLKSHGFTILPNFLNTLQVSHFKNLVRTYFEDEKNKCKGYNNATIKPDGINDPYFEDLKDIFSNPQLIEVINLMTENNTRYVHHFDIHLNKQGSQNWHTDVQNSYSEGKHSLGNLKGIWDKNNIKEDYGVYRIALYLQDHTHQGGLSVIPASHLVENNAKVLSTYQSFEDPFYIKSKAGDCVVFDARLLHKGNPHNEARYSMFSALGIDNDHSKNHAKGAIARQIRQNLQKDYTLQPYLKDVFKNQNIKYDY